MTNDPMAGSKAMDEVNRGGGRVAEVSLVQLVPSNDQVSLLSAPANNTMVPVAGSKAMDACTRAEGLVAGVSSLQWVPSKVHVSPKAPPTWSSPPKRTIPMD